jgi:hypothetical protein
MNTGLNRIMVLLLLPNCNAGSLSITVSKYLSSAHGGDVDGFN